LYGRAGRFTARVGVSRPGQRERGVLDVRARYPRLHISQDFASLQSSWLDTCPPERPLDLTTPLPYLIHPQAVVRRRACTRTAAAASSVSWTRVTLGNFW
jgi:hypothetical protein